MNPADIRSAAALRELGNTPAGRNWSIKYIHPCGEGLDCAVKTPDGASQLSVSMERRDDYLLKFTGDITKESTWTCLVIHMPFLCLDRLALAWGQTMSPTEDDLNTVVSEAIEKYDWNDPSFNKARYPDWASATPREGVIVYYQILQPSVLFPTTIESGHDLASVTHTTREIRRVYYGSTTDLDANDLTNQGRITAGQFPPNIAKRTQTHHRDVKGAGAEGEVVSVVEVEKDIWMWNLPPFTTNDITQQDRKSYQAEAKDGLYSPCRTWNEKNSYTAIAGGRYVHAIWGNSEAADETNFIQAERVDFALEAWGCMVELYEGISTSANLRLKIREGLELQPATHSPYQPFQTEGWAQDDVAMVVAREFSRTSPHHYIADMNHSNGLLGGLLGGLGRAIGNLGIPIISDIAGIVAGIFG